MPWAASRVDSWTPARKHPETYPGDRPPSSYVLLDDHVCPLLLDDPETPRMVTVAGEVEDVDAALERAGLPSLSERVAVLSYGGNRNPATLLIKLHNYAYACPGTAVAIPMLRGSMVGVDVAACGLSGQGYLFGDLLVDGPLVRDTRCEVWIALVDRDQLRVLHESEIGTGDYVAARFPGVTVDLAGEDRALRGPVLGYAARRPCFVSPVLGKPLAFSSIDAEHRALPEMSPVQMLDHVLDRPNLRERALALAASDVNGDLALGVSRFMNRNWWRRFSGLAPDDGYDPLLRLVERRIAANVLERSSAAILAERGLVMSDDESYLPDASLTWGRL